MVEVPETNQAYYDSIPNGGYGWVVVVCVFLINFIMFGTSAIWGVFADTFAITVLEGKSSTLGLMGVGAVMEITLNLFSPIGPLLSPLGPQLTLGLGSVLMSLGIILSSFITEMWHLYFTMGIVFGIGTGMVYISVVSIIPQWFTTRRGTAMGISFSGSGVGGLALSPMVTSLVSKYGLPWSIRIVGLMAFAICATGAMFIRGRPLPTTGKQQSRLPIEWNMLKNTNFIVLVFGLVMSLTGYLIPLFYLPTYARAFGVTSVESSNLVGVMCGTNAVGRIVLGFVGDRVGRMNTLVVISCTAGIFCALLWSFATTYQTMMAYSVLFGFTGGIYYPLAPPITATVVGQENIASGLTLMFLASSISGIGPPVSAAIQMATPNNGFIGIQLFSGALYIVGGLIVYALKVKMTKSFFSIF
ncbi:major facilitator superfamily domain-containing protein [Sporodiniella umbellata]|nr:major facilitator superfamily domain-containing protein [Sporodiniella umbellata]